MSAYCLTAALGDPVLGTHALHLELYVWNRQQGAITVSAHQERAELSAMSTVST